MDKAAVLQRIRDAGVVAVLRTDTAEEAVAAVQALHVGGIEVVEITYTIPHATRAIQQLVSWSSAAAPQLLVGAGTVVNAAQAQEALGAGARFLVSPCFVADVLDVARELDVPLLSGAFTPTEVFDTWSAGADVVKLFPASQFGPAYIRELHGPFPQIPILPTSGVRASTAGEWLRAGAFALGAGSHLVDREAVKRGDWQHLTDNARELVAAVRAARA
jgi:2-dehydro-3-deoxyphosphogluconate aldolase / (4S)-4-hydroxy-2-oxoglutarate aldolase